MMWWLVLRRILIGLLLVWIVSVLVFVATQILPGDAAEIRLGRTATEETLAALRKQMGLDRPAVVQYGMWMSRLLSGDLGMSLAGGSSVASLISARIGNTLFMAGIVTVISVPLSIALGLLAAMHSGGWIERVITSCTLGLIALPDFLIAVLLILVLAVGAGLVPAVAYIGPEDTLLERLHALALPILTLVVVVSAQMIRMVRAGILNVLSSPYIEMAILKGVPRRRIILRHALLNAVGPTLNVIALNLAYLVSGVVVVETIFAYPGIAKLMIDAVQTRDMALVQACAMIFCSTYVLLMLAADIAAIVSNPRIRHPK